MMHIFKWSTNFFFHGSSKVFLPFVIRSNKRLFSFFATTSSIRFSFLQTNNRNIIDVIPFTLHVHCCHFWEKSHNICCLSILVPLFFSDILFFIFEGRCQSKHSGTYPAKNKSKTIFFFFELIVLYHCGLLLLLLDRVALRRVDVPMDIIVVNL